MEGQDSFIMRELEDAEVDFGEDCEDVVADVGNNADLYAANQESTDLINEAHSHGGGSVMLHASCSPFTMGGQDVLLLLDILPSAA